MSQVLRSFPQANRSGTQQTTYAQIPAGVDYIQLTGQASAPTLSDTLNGIQFVLLTSPTGQDSDSHEIQREDWHGGTRVNKVTHVTEPNPIDITFNLQTVDVGSKISLRATFYNTSDTTQQTSRTINVGATVTGLAADEV